MLTVYLIRHGRTEGNRRGAYIGRTDEPLSEIGKAELLPYIEKRPLVDAVYSSPMLRCRETAGLFYPEREPVLIEGLKEFDFGAFEGRTFDQLKDAPGIQEWIDSHGRAPFPGGEDWTLFHKRCIDSFAQAVLNSFESGRESAAVFAHGGVIITIMAQLMGEDDEPFRFHAKNGEGFAVAIDRPLFERRRARGFSPWPDGANAPDVVLKRFEAGK
ncbi:MAG: histidine phosphatase family protein [Bacillota bacterium]